MENEPITSLRARYGQESTIAQQEGLSLPPFEEWIRLQEKQNKPDNNTLASLATPSRY